MTQATQSVADVLTTGAMRELVAHRLLKVESPDDLWVHVDQLERERLRNHAEMLLAELAEAVRTRT